MLQKPSAALIFLNGGLGNGLILGPAFRQLEHALPQLIYYSPPNDMLEADWVRDALSIHGPVPALPPLWRRFLPDDHTAILDFAASVNATLIINFRMEAARLDANYFDFRDQATGQGIDCWDLHQLRPAEQYLPIGEQAQRLLASHEVPPLATRRQWLARYRAGREGVIGLYVGASVAVKRWPADRWSALVAPLRSAGLTIEVAAGPQEPERGLAQQLSSVPDSGTRVRFPAAVPELRDWIASLDALVTNDTITAHLAAALGCPAVGLYLATDSSIWSPVTTPGTFVAVQSDFALHCVLMKPDGTCQRFYSGCPAPCRVAVGPDQVLRALATVTSSVPPLCARAPRSALAVTGVAGSGRTPASERTVR